MTVRFIKISKKGRITLPREARQALGTDVVKVIVDGGKVLIEPVEDLAGSLRRYAKAIPLEEAKDRAWTEAIGEKYGIRD